MFRFFGRGKKGEDPKGLKETGKKDKDPKGLKETGKKGKNPKGHKLDPSPSSTPCKGHVDGTLVINGKAFNCYMEDFKLLYDLGLYGSPLNQMIHEPTGHIMTVQILNVSSTYQREMMLNALNGFVVRQIDCPHIATIYGVMANEQNVWICMEPMRASVLDFSDIPGRRIPEEVLREIAITVLRALTDLQNLNIPHGVAWLDHILVDDKANFKFSFVRDVQNQVFFDDPFGMQIRALGILLIWLATGTRTNILPADEPCSDEFRDFVAQWYALSLFLMCASISCLLYSSKVIEILYLNTIVLAISASTKCKMQVFAPRISSSEKFWKVGANFLDIIKY